MGGSGIEVTPRWDAACAAASSKGSARQSCAIGCDAASPPLSEVARTASAATVGMCGGAEDGDARCASARATLRVEEASRVWRREGGSSSRDEMCSECRSRAALLAKSRVVATAERISSRAAHTTLAGGRAASKASSAAPTIARSLGAVFTHATAKTAILARSRCAPLIEPVISSTPPASREPSATSTPSIVPSATSSATSADASVPAPVGENPASVRMLAT